MSDRDYVLGTHDAEIERLGMQHQVWRARSLDVWQRAGIGPGLTVIDVGAGPGYAALDLAETVGASGHVIAVERSRRFLDTLHEMAQRRGIANITSIEADVVDAGFGEGVADATWCRWVLSFVLDPRAVVAHLARALKPGGVAVFHEYLDYRTWRLAPRAPAFEHFVEEVIESIRAGGGYVDSALALPTSLAEAGFEIVTLKPIIDVVPPASAIWKWPASFTTVFLERLAASGQLSAEEARATRAAIGAAEADPRSLMVTPTVLEIIARKR
jgi:ubiquinone/menaquinone biosynthesis C-methylase UbiE